MTGNHWEAILDVLIRRALTATSLCFWWQVKSSHPAPAARALFPLRMSVSQEMEILVRREEKRNQKMSLWPFLLSLVSLRLVAHLLLVRRRLSNQLFFSPARLRPSSSRLFTLLSSLFHFPFHSSSPPSLPLRLSSSVFTPHHLLFSAFSFTSRLHLSNLSFLALSSFLRSLCTQRKIVFNIILALFLSHGNIVLTATKRGISHGNTFGLFVVRKSPNGTNNISSVWFKHLVGNVFLWKFDWSRAEKETFIKRASMCHDRAPFNIHKIEKLYYDGTFISFLKSP